MNFFLKLSFLITALYLSGCASSPSKIPLNEVTVVEEGSDLDEQGLANQKKYKMICKTFAPTGTRIGKKECRTKEAWDHLARIAKDRLDKASKPQSNNRQENPPPKPIGVFKGAAT